MDKKGLFDKKNPKPQIATSLSSNAVVMVAIKMWGRPEDLSITKKSHYIQDTMF